MNELSDLYRDPVDIPLWGQIANLEDVATLSAELSGNCDLKPEQDATEIQLAINKVGEDNIISASIVDGSVGTTKLSNLDHIGLVDYVTGVVYKLRIGNGRLEIMTVETPNQNTN